jgi:hypothetical protein
MGPKTKAALYGSVCTLSGVIVVNAVQAMSANERATAPSSRALYFGAIAGAVGGSIIGAIASVSSTQSSTTGVGALPRASGAINAQLMPAQTRRA